MPVAPPPNPPLALRCCMGRKPTVVSCGFFRAPTTEVTLYMSESASKTRGGFDRFLLHEALNRGIQSAGFETPRPIQVEAIPTAMGGGDVLGLAQTGTGKTAAFALPVLNRLLNSPRQKNPRALVIAPTRQ